MELLPLGPVVIIDTPGYGDDEQELGQKRVLRTKRVLNKTDVAVLVVDGTKGLQKDDRELLALFREKNIPHLVVFNKKDLFDAAPADVLCVSTVTGEGIFELKERLGALAPKESGRKLLSDLVSPDGLVVLVTPIDESAPKGRMILPQVQAIRDVLDGDACCVVVKETQLAALLSSLGRTPDMVVTDSQAFAVVSKIVPEDIPLTSFSILMARCKGFLETAVRRRVGASPSSRWRQGSHLRGLHAPPAVRGYWSREASPMAEGLQRGGHFRRAQLRHGISRGPRRVFPCAALRRVHALRAGDALPHEVRAGPGDSLYELRRSYRLHERHFAQKPQPVPGTSKIDRRITKRQTPYKGSAAIFQVFRRMRSSPLMLKVYFLEFM